MICGSTDFGFSDRDAHGAGAEDDGDTLGTRAVPFDQTVAVRGVQVLGAGVDSVEHVYLWFPVGSDEYDLLSVVGVSRSSIHKLSCRPFDVAC